MKLAVLSDIHDNLWNLEHAIQAIERTADVLFCCGDLCSPFVIDVLAKFTRDVHIVFGNNDADLFRITSKASREPRVHVHGEFFETRMENKRVAMHHFDNVARPLAESGRYDLVLFGHNHELEISRTNSCLLINPGPIMGAKFPAGEWQYAPPTYVTLDTQSGEAEAHTIGRLPFTPRSEH